MNKPLEKAVERMAERGYSADAIRRAAQLLKEKYIKEGNKQNENK